MSDEQKPPGDAVVPVIVAEACNHVCLDGRPCGKPVAARDGRCEEHTAIHGRRSEGGVRPTARAVRRKQPIQYGKILPTHLQPAFRKIQKSRDLASIHSDIALVQVRVELLASRLQSGEDTKSLLELRGMWNELESALRVNDEDAVRLWMSSIKGVIYARAADEIIWREINEQLAFKAKLVEQENKRHYIMGATATAEQVRYLVECIMTAVLDNVRDVETRRKIINDIRALQVFDWEAAPPFDAEVFTG